MATPNDILSVWFYTCMLHVYDHYQNEINKVLIKNSIVLTDMYLFSTIFCMCFFTSFRFFDGTSSRPWNKLYTFTLVTVSDVQKSEYM